MSHLVRPLVVVWLLSAFLPLAVADEPAFIPRKQTKPPNAPLGPTEAIALMKVPEGFTVELVASEPDIVNPVAMTFDERGRIWITESLEYPRHEPGPGRDRVKVLEDTDGDGRTDKVTVFAEGLNIPSGIAVGAGGVWVANAPDLLFYPDRDGDLRPEGREVVCTGFGRSDTHELPNSLNWGPDGRLYGFNGVFNPSRVKSGKQTLDFTCAMFRIDPRTRAFDLFCEGTSNPWGITWDSEGSAFVSACVIDHLWHLTETGYYHRQGGPYPPFTWKIESIVEHKHQLAAYCGIHWYDSDAYPPAYRQRLFMGNVHGNCVNVDRLERRGSSYFGLPEPDFLSSSDAWFMPVSQKTGPDGCLYILDWYDRYHCYQDANRDPAGVDRLKGRLYRVRYHDTPRAKPFDLARESDEQLIARLGSPTSFFREQAQRLLAERAQPATNEKLIALALDAGQPRRTRLHALWAAIGAGPLAEAAHLRVLADPDPTFRAWGVRAAGNQRLVSKATLQRIVALAADESPDVQLQVAIAARKIERLDPLPLLVEVASRCASDSLIPHIVWQNVQPLLERDAAGFVRALEKHDPRKQPGLRVLIPRVLERIVASKDLDPQVVRALLAPLVTGPRRDEALATECLTLLVNRVETHQLAGSASTALANELKPLLGEALSTAAKGSDLAVQAMLLAATWGDETGRQHVHELLADRKAPDRLRLSALATLIAANGSVLPPEAATLLADTKAGLGFRRQLLETLARSESPDVATLLLSAYAGLEPALRPTALDVLCQRPAWSKALLAVVAAGKIAPSELNVNQVRQLQGSKDAGVAQQTAALWGQVRTDRNPEREQVVQQMRWFVHRHPGDPKNGRLVFDKLCGQCHKIYGRGADVGPDITLNGRSSFEQLLSNIFDPSLVIGPAYQARTVATTDGRVLTGLLAEDNPQRIVLKQQGGKLETIARGDIEAVETSRLSLMPEGVEKQLSPTELADLLAFITLDKPPEDPSAQRLAGAGDPVPTYTNDPAQFDDLLAEVAPPGFHVVKSGEGGVSLLAEHLGKRWVVRTHPLSREEPALVRGKVKLPAGKPSLLVVDVSSDRRGDWQLVIRAGGRELHNSTVNASATKDGWRQVVVDLAPWAGQTIDLELVNAANGWTYEFAYWGKIVIETP